MILAVAGRKADALNAITIESVGVQSAAAMLYPRFYADTEQSFARYLDWVMICRNKEGRIIKDIMRIDLCTGLLRHFLRSLLEQFQISLKLFVLQAHRKCLGISGIRHSVAGAGCHQIRPVNNGVLI